MKYNSLRLTAALSLNLLGIYFYHPQGNTYNWKTSYYFRRITLKTNFNSEFKLAEGIRKYYNHAFKYDFMLQDDRNQNPMKLA